MFTQTSRALHTCILPGSAFLREQVSTVSSETVLGCRFNRGSAINFSEGRAGACPDWFVSMCSHCYYGMTRSRASAVSNCCELRRHTLAHERNLYDTERHGCGAKLDKLEALHFSSCRGKRNEIDRRRSWWKIYSLYITITPGITSLENLWGGSSVMHSTDLTRILTTC